MQPDRFTINSQEAIQAAQRLAEERHNPQTTPEHLLAVLLEQDAGVVVSVLRKVGVDPAAVRQALAPGLDSLPTLSGATEPAGGWSELTQILRDRLALALTLVLPCILLFLMGTSIALKVGGLPIIVQDFDDSAASRDFIATFRNSLSFHVVSWPVQERPERAFSRNHARAALIIPRHFGRDLLRGVNTPVQMLIDASDSNTATLASGDASQIVRAYNELQAGATRGAPASTIARYERSTRSQRLSRSIA